MDKWMNDGFFPLLKEWIHSMLAFSMGQVLGIKRGASIEEVSPGIGGTGFPREGWSYQPNNGDL